MKGILLGEHSRHGSWLILFRREICGFTSGVAQVMMREILNGELA